MKYWSFILSLVILMSCSQLEGNLQVEQDKGSEYSTIVMSISSSRVIDDEPVTKNVAIKNDVTQDWDFVWSAKDSIGIFPDAGSQIYYSMSSGAGQVSARFDGGGWALKKGSSYFSYYPFTPDFYINKEAIPLTYVGQTQYGNAEQNRADLGKYGYMVAKGEADEATGSLCFNYEKLGCLQRVRIPVTAGTYKSLTLYTDDDVIVKSGTYNAVDISLNIENPVYSNSITLNFENLTFSNDGDVLVAFLLIAPFDYLNRQVTYELTKADGTKERSSVRGKTYLRDMVYLNAPHFNISPSTVSVSGDSNGFEFKILASGTHTYSITTDVDWLTLNSKPTSGSKTVLVAVEKNTGAKRTGHIIISETVNGVLLENVVTVRQYAEGFNVDVEDWEDDGVYHDGTAQ